MLLKKLLFVSTILFSHLLSAQSFDCSQPRPEMPGFHNMVLFGDPTDQLYAYHLPLFSGQVHGEQGHVLMHVYQGLFTVGFDSTTRIGYANKFSQKKTDAKPIPFFSFSPQGERFKVPEMICDRDFSTEVYAVYGHVENNPDFPEQEELKDGLSTMTKEKTLFARRFDGSSKSQLSYILFGTSKQYYLAHYLTDDENSFDQIIAVKSIDKKLQQQLSVANSILLEVPVTKNPHLELVSETSDLASPNNKWKLPSDGGEVIQIKTRINGSVVESHLEVVSEVYFNNNADLRVN